MSTGVWYTGVGMLGTANDPLPDGANKTGRQRTPWHCPNGYGAS